MKNKTKAQLIDEIERLQKRVNELQKSETKSKQTLKDSDIDFRTIVENGMDGIYIFNLEGFEYNDFVGKHFTKLPTLQLKDLPKYSKMMKSMIRGNNPKQIEFNWVHKSGKVLLGEARLSILRKKGKISGFQIIAVDITKRRQMEDALKESEKKFREMANLLPQIVYEADINGNLSYINKEACAIFGYSIDDFDKGINIVQVLAPEDIARAKQNILNVLKGKPIKNQEYTAVRKDGSTFPILIYSNPIIEDKEPVGLRGLIVDNTERKQAEEALIRSEEKHRVLFETMAQEVVYQDKDGEITSANPAAERILGLTLNQMQNRKSIDPRWRAIHEDGSDFQGETHPAMIALKTGKEVNNVKMGVFSPALDEYRWININARLKYRSGEDAPIQVYTTFYDFTECKQAEEEIRHKTEDLALINTLNEAVNQGDSLLQIQQLLIREIKRMFSCFGATLFLLSEDREYLVMQILDIPPAIVSQIEKLVGMRIPAVSIPLKAGSLYRKALQEVKPQLFNDPKTTQRLMSEFTENKILKKLVPTIYPILNIHSVINVPLVTEGEAIGLLNFARKEPFTEFELKRFETIAGQLTSIIKRKQVENERKENMRQLERFNRLSVGRELKMIELKKEINELLREAGRTEKYKISSKE